MLWLRTFPCHRFSLTPLGPYLVTQSLRLGFKLYLRHREVGHAEFVLVDSFHACSQPNLTMLPVVWWSNGKFSWKNNVWMLSQIHRIFRMLWKRSNLHLHIFHRHTRCITMFLGIVIKSLSGTSCSELVWTESILLSLFGLGVTVFSLTVMFNNV